METKCVDTYTATIYVGTYNRDTDETLPMSLAYDVCQQYVDQVGLCVTVTPTRFIYTNGWEDGVAVGLINYPRFPSLTTDIKKHALTLAALLQKAYDQYRVSIVFPTETHMLTKDGVTEA